MEDLSENLMENPTKDLMEDSSENSMENPTKDPIQEHQDVGDTEEFTSEESKENIYEDVPQ